MKRFPLGLLVVLASAVLLLVASADAQQPGPQTAASAAGKASKDKAKTMTPEEATDPTDPLFGIGPLPQGPVSLVGGTLDKIDRVREHLRVRPFGDSRRLSIVFDERTHIYRDGVETTERGLRRGDRVYVDTMLDGGRLFARNIRVVTNLKPADARGQIESYDPNTGVMTVRDDLSGTSVTFRVTRWTAVKGSGLGAGPELVPGALVNVRFEPDQHDPVAHEVSVVAKPGSTFTFVGKVRHLDMRSGILAIETQPDSKLYELEFAPGTVGQEVMVGSEVVIRAEFVGHGYKAETVTVSDNAQAKE